jgi:hypothetical protein
MPESVITNMVPEPPSSICTTGPMPHIINGALLSLIRYQFADISNITQPALHKYLWNKDEKTSAILIEPVYKWNPRNIQQRPAVIVKRGPWKVHRISIGDRLHAYVADEGYSEFTQQVLMVGSHVLFCVGRTGLEAEEIGTEVAMHMLGFSELIRQQLSLARFQLDSIGDVHRIVECQDHFAVPVTVTYGMQLNWEVVRQAPIWMRTLATIEVKE